MWPYPNFACCSFCEDYKTTDDWYGLICNLVQHPTTGFANRASTPNYKWFWDSDFMAVELNSLLVNWNFDDSTDLIENTCALRRREMSFASVISDISATLYWRIYDFFSFPSDAIGDYTAATMEFKDIGMYILMSDLCPPASSVTGNPKYRTFSITFWAKVYQNGVLQPSTSIFPAVPKFSADHSLFLSIVPTTSEFDLDCSGTLKGSNISAPVNFHFDESTFGGFSYGLLGTATLGKTLGVVSHDSSISCAAYS